MNDIDQILINITDTLKNEGVDKIILFGLMPYGKPTPEDAEIYFREAVKIKKQTETFLNEQG